MILAPQKTRVLWVWTDVRGWERQPVKFEELRGEWANQKTFGWKHQGRKSALASKVRICSTKKGRGRSSLMNDARKVAPEDSLVFAMGCLTIDNARMPK